MGRPRRNHRSTAAAIRAAPSASATTGVVDDDEVRIYNEQIRYREAVEFLQQQELLLQQLPRKPRHSEKDSTTASRGETTARHPHSPHHPTTATAAMIQLTRGMLRTLQQMQMESCTCPLCHQIYIQPISLVTCTHTFCQSCIHDYTDHSWYCPSTCMRVLVCCDYVFLYECLYLLYASYLSCFYSSPILQITRFHETTRSQILECECGYVVVWCWWMFIYIYMFHVMIDSLVRTLTHSHTRAMLQSCVVTQTVVTSWANICHTLRQADDHWWEIQNLTTPPPAASWNVPETDENAILRPTTPVMTKRTSPESVPTTRTQVSSSRVTFTTTTHVPPPTKKFRSTLGQSESTNSTEDEEEEEVEDEQCYATPMDEDDSVSLF